MWNSKGNVECGMWNGLRRTAAIVFLREVSDFSEEFHLGIVVDFGFIAVGVAASALGCIVLAYNPVGIAEYIVDGRGVLRFGGLGDLG